MPLTRTQIISFLDHHKDEFAQQYSVTKLGLFGSYAKGEGVTGNDIDIVVELARPDMFSLIGVKQAIEEGLGSKVDVIRLRDRMNQTLRRKIEQDAIYV